jgi:leader peptidase (prepilin peptidase)/N-methyltransferase
VTAPMLTAQTVTVVALAGVLGLPVGRHLRRVMGRVRRPPPAKFPVVEAATGLFFAVVAWWAVTGPAAALLGGPGASGPAAVGAWLLLVACLYLAAVSVVLTVIDLDTHTLPDRVVLPSYLIGGALLTAAALVQADFGRLLGAALGLVLLWSLYFLLAVLSPAGMGYGDVKLAGLLGLYLGWLGWGPLVVGAAGAFVLGGSFAIVLLTTRRLKRTAGIPFGPWMLAGAWVGVLAGPALWEIYLVAVMSA